MDALLKGFSSELESLTNLTPSLSSLSGKKIILADVLSLISLSLGPFLSCRRPPGSRRNAVLQVCDNFGYAVLHFNI